MKVLVIGGGNMGLTYAEGMTKSDLLKGNLIMVLDKSEEKLKELNQNPLFEAYSKFEDCVPQADIIFIAVKPYHTEGLFDSIKSLLKPNQIIVSIMAGVTLATLKRASGLDKVVRAMPNLPAQINKGMTSFVVTNEVSKQEASNVENLLSTTGKAIQVSTEEFIDASTGISGSGPAYVFYFMNSMMDAAIEMGFSQDDSRLLVTQTFAGAVDLFNQSDLTPTEWMSRVASKGGTTQAALDSMDNNKVNKYIKEATFAAFNRAVELGKEN